MKKGFIKKLAKFEYTHRIFTFIFILILTILITRGLVMIKDPNPVLFGFELHHFDYGFILLLITSMSILFERRRHPIYIVMSAAAIGLMIDQIIFIRSNLGLFFDISKLNELNTYEATFPFVALIAIVIVLLLVVVNYFDSSKRKNKKHA